MRRTGGWSGTRRGRPGWGALLLKFFELEAAPIVRERMRLAVSEAMAELAAQGMVMPVDAHQDGHDLSVSVGGRGWAGGERVRAPRPRLHTTYRLTRSHIGRDDFRFFDHDQYLEGLDDLVGARGGRCVREALDVYRRGLYLSAANMLGAASEAAWYTLGEALRGHITDLDGYLDNDTTAQVIRVVAGHLEQVKRQRTTVTELRAHAAYLRDLRNYGIHPRGEVDEDHEGAFTETGCAVLLMQTRRYFARLRSVAVAAQLLPDGEAIGSELRSPGR